MIVPFLLSTALTVPQSVPQEYTSAVAKFRIDPTSFPAKYSFKVELQAKIILGRIRTRIVYLESQTEPQREYTNTLDSKTFNWEISYDDGSPNIKASPQSLEITFPPWPPTPPDAVINPTNSSRPPNGGIEFEGELTLLIDDKTDSIVPLKHTNIFSPDTEYVLQIKNNGIEDDIPQIGINFLPKVESGSERGTSSGRTLVVIPKSPLNDTEMHFWENHDGTRTPVNGKTIVTDAEGNRKIVDIVDGKVQK